ncbi:hypothetical protein [Lutibacter sp.]
MRFEFNGEILERKIIGIESLTGTNEKMNTGIRIESPNEKEISDLRNWNPNLCNAEIFELINNFEIPKKIGGANLIEYLVLNKKHKWTVKTEHFISGKLVNEFYALAICQYESSNEFYLFYCDENWNEKTDTLHDSIKDAKDQADFEFENTISNWTQN